MSTKEIQENKVWIPKKNALIMTWCLIYTMCFPSIHVDFLLLTVISSSAKRDQIGTLQDSQITSLLKW